MILFINSCPRTDSRTRLLADALLEKLGPYEEADLFERTTEKSPCSEKSAALRNSYSFISLEPLNEKRLARRTELIEKGAFDDPMFAPARAFAAADVIVIAAPYWDLSFPAALKVYLENIYITGLVSKYNEQGIPEGLCKAEKLYFITTAGGPYFPDFGYNCIEQLTVNCFGVKNTELFKAEMLDVQGMDSEKIMEEAIQKVISSLS